MKRVLFAVLVIASYLIVFGAQYDGRDFANGVGLSGNSTVRVHQWLTVQYNEKIKRIDIYDYDTEYTYEPNDNYIMSILVLVTNADLKVKVTGDLKKDDQVYNDYLTVMWRLYEFSPELGTYYPSSGWINLGSEIILEDHATSSMGQTLGLGMKFTADKDLPAGEYLFEYKVILNPTVSFSS